MRETLAALVRAGRGTLVLEGAAGMGKTHHYAQALGAEELRHSQALVRWVKASCCCGLVAYMGAVYSCTHVLIRAVYAAYLRPFSAVTLTVSTSMRPFFAFRQLFLQLFTHLTASPDLQQEGSDLLDEGLEEMRAHLSLGTSPGGGLSEEALLDQGVCARVLLLCLYQPGHAHP
jgi:hypothetical protein